MLLSLVVESETNSVIVLTLVEGSVCLVKDVQVYDSDVLFNTVIVASDLSVIKLLLGLLVIRSKIICLQNQD